MKTGQREVSTADMPIGQMPNIDLDKTVGLAVRTNEAILPVDTPMINEEFEHIKFMEDPVTIRIEASGEKFAPTHIPVAVNGRGVEILVDDKWQEVNYIELGRVLTVKRKYVEVLARAKPTDIQTIHEDATVERPRNEVRRVTRAAHPMTIISDPNPKGIPWLTRIMAEG